MAPRGLVMAAALDEEIEVKLPGHAVDSRAGPGNDSMSHSRHPDLPAYFMRANHSLTLPSGDAGMSRFLLIARIIGSR
jgi:hypothetical protein